MQYNQEQFLRNKKSFDKETPIETLMDDAYIIQEIHDNNQSLMEYLNQDRLSQILDYLIKDMDYVNQDKPEKAFKYPKVAADLLSTNCTAIREFFEYKNEEGKLKHFN